jgi:hypothetical protein
VISHGKQQNLLGGQLRQGGIYLISHLSSPPQRRKGCRVALSPAFPPVICKFFYNYFMFSPTWRIQCFHFISCPNVTLLTNNSEQVECSWWFMGEWNFSSMPMTGHLLIPSIHVPVCLSISSHSCQHKFFFFDPSPSSSLVPGCCFYISASPSY